jgi:hypothetical protein
MPEASRLKVMIGRCESVSTDHLPLEVTGQAHHGSIRLEKSDGEYAQSRVYLGRDKDQRAGTWSTGSSRQPLDSSRTVDHHGTALPSTPNFVL